MIDFLLDQEWQGFTHILQIMGIGILFFSVLYFVTGLLTIFITRLVLPQFNYGNILILVQFNKNNYRRECVYLCYPFLFLAPDLFSHGDCCSRLGTDQSSYHIGVFAEIFIL